jgi:hypothetical protein
MRKPHLTKQALERAVLSEIRSSYGCEDVQGVTVEFVVDPRSGANWRIVSINRTGLSILHASANDLQCTARAVEAAHRKLRETFNLKQPR